MTLVLSGIVAVQWYWIKTAYEVKDEQFQRSVNDVLFSVVNKLETRDAVVFINDKITNFQTDSSKESTLQSSNLKTNNSKTDLSKNMPKEEKRKKIADHNIKPPSNSVFITIPKKSKIKTFDSLPKNDHLKKAKTTLFNKHSVFAFQDSMIHELEYFRNAYSRNPNNKEFIWSENLPFSKSQFEFNIEIFNDTAFEQLEQTIYSVTDSVINNESTIILKSRINQNHQMTFSYSSNNQGFGNHFNYLKNDSIHKEFEMLDDFNFSDSNVQPRLANVQKEMEHISIKQKSKKLKSVFKQIAFEYETANKPILARLQLLSLDTLLREELNNKGIKLPYEFGVIMTSSDSTLPYHSTQFTNRFEGNAFKQLLFPNDIFAKGYSLKLYFPDQKTHIIQSLSWIMIISLLFSLILLFTFSFTILIILKQKKIAEIKTDFINNMTHEFKTPIATISLAVDSISNPKVLENKDKLLYFAQKIKEESKRLNKQVENILQMSLLEKPNFKLNLQLNDIHYLIKKAIDNISIQIEKNNGTISASLTAEDYICQVDEVHFTNVIYNLLDNANKYSGQTPTILVSTTNINSGIVISVEDKGIGMAKETMDKIFEKFYRAQSGNIHNVKGFGLGLSYVKAIVTAHKGRITVKSEKGNGTRFDIYLPVNE